jgi:serine O-acetyltransferase
MAGGGPARASGGGQSPLELWRLVLSDLGRKAQLLGRGPGLRTWVYVCLADGSGTQLVYRLMRFFQKNRLGPLALVAYKLNSLVGGSVIGRGADFGPGLVVFHGNGIVVNGDVVAGRDLVLQHQVTIGAEKGLSPRLGDDVYVGAGAKIIGGVSVGSRVRIGANAVVIHDVPDGATCVGVPARVVRIEKGDDADVLRPDDRRQPAG